jgi:hypothetical protein
MTKLTKEQAVCISAYTGILTSDFSDMHEYIEKKLGKPVFTHEMANPLVMEEIKNAVKSDFLALIP